MLDKDDGLEDDDDDDTLEQLELLDVLPDRLEQDDEDEDADMLEQDDEDELLDPLDVELSDELDDEQDDELHDELDGDEDDVEIDEQDEDEEEEDDSSSKNPVNCSVIPHVPDRLTTRVCGMAVTKRGPLPYNRHPVHREAAPASRSATKCSRRIPWESTAQNRLRSGRTARPTKRSNRGRWRWLAS